MEGVGGNTDDSFRMRNISSGVSLSADLTLFGSTSLVWQFRKEAIPDWSRGWFWVAGRTQRSNVSCFPTTPIYRYLSCGKILGIPNFAGRQTY